ncbi:MAG: hypothetical protein ACP5O2_03165 [Bacteroidales bacterium]
MKNNTLEKLERFWQEVFPVKALPVHPLGLSFLAEPLEKEFRKFYYQRHLPAIRFVIIVSTFIFLSFQFFDYFISNEFSNAALPVRFYIYLPFSILVLYFTYSDNFSDLWNYLVMGWILSTTLAGVICIYLEPEEVRVISSIDLLVFISISYYIFGIKPTQALVIVLIESVIILFLLHEWGVIPSPYMVSVALLMVIVTIAGFYTAWRFEMAARREFFLDRKVERLIQERELLYTENLLADQAFMRINPSYRDGRRIRISNLLTGKIKQALHKDINQALGYSLLAEEECMGGSHLKDYFTSLKSRILDLSCTAENINTIAAISHNLVTPRSIPVNLRSLLVELKDKFCTISTNMHTQGEILIHMDEEWHGKLINTDPEILQGIIMNLSRVLCTTHPEGQLIYSLHSKAERKPARICLEISCQGKPTTEEVINLVDATLGKALTARPVTNMEKEELFLTTALELTSLLENEIDYYITPDRTLSFELLLKVDNHS